jgi:hypothetical protein
MTLQEFLLEAFRLKVTDCHLKFVGKDTSGVPIVYVHTVNAESPTLRYAVVDDFLIAEDTNATEEWKQTPQTRLALKKAEYLAKMTKGRPVGVRDKPLVPGAGRKI